MKSIGAELDASIAEAAVAEVERLRAQRDELLAAAKTVLAGLNARIEAAPVSAVPVFSGIADLHDAIARAEAA